MPDNKLVIRRLPPSMSEDEFLKQVSPLPDHDYFCFFEANSGLGKHSYNRAYINFLNETDMVIFRERFDNYIFLDKDGHEYPAVVEQPFWQRSPESGPFFSGPSAKSNPSTAEQQMKKSLEEDPDFLEFTNKLQAQRKGKQPSAVPTLETNLDELTNPSGGSPGSKDQNKVVTPLIDYVNQKMLLKSSKKTRRVEHDR